MLLRQIHAEKVIKFGEITESCFKVFLSYRKLLVNVCTVLLCKLPRVDFDEVTHVEVRECETVRIASLCGLCLERFLQCLMHIHQQ